MFVNIYRILQNIQFVYIETIVTFLNQLQHLRSEMQKIRSEMDGLTLGLKESEVRLLKDLQRLLQ